MTTYKEITAQIEMLMKQAEQVRRNRSDFSHQKENA